MQSNHNHHMVGLVGNIEGEREIGGVIHYHMKFAEYPGVDYHFLADNVALMKESNAEVDAS